MKQHYFVFCKEDLLLEKTADGGYTIPFQEEPPTEVKPWTNVMTVTPLDGVEVKTYKIDSPACDRAFTNLIKPCTRRQANVRNCCIGMPTPSIVACVVPQCEWIPTSRRNVLSAAKRYGHN